MVCQKCRGEMIPVERQKYGVNAEMCTACGGVWLEKGEFGELVARASRSSALTNQGQSRVQPPRTDYGRSYRDKRHRTDDHDDDHDYRYKKRSLWDIFD